MSSVFVNFLVSCTLLLDNFVYHGIHRILWYTKIYYYLLIISQQKFKPRYTAK